MNARLFLGFGMAVLGLLLLLIRSLIYVDNPPAAFHSSDFVLVDREALRATQAGSNDWPVLVARHFLVESPRPPEIYRLRIGGMRGTTSEIRLDVASESSQRTEALAAWLAVAFAKSLQQSLPKTASSPGDPAAWSWGEAAQYSSPESGRWFMILVDFLPPILLVAAGIVVFRLRHYMPANR